MPGIFAAGRAPPPISTLNVEVNADADSSQSAILRNTLTAVPVLPPPPSDPLEFPPAMPVSALPAAACRRLFLLGAGRSGTSLLAGLFRRSGLFMGESTYKLRPSNPHGLFEDREVNAINEALLASLLPAPPLRSADGLEDGQDVPGEGQRWLARLPLEAKVEANSELEQRILSLYARGSSCFKDPRFCYTLAVWRKLLPAEDEEHTAFLCVFRDPAVVLASVLEEVHSALYLGGLAISVDQVLACWRWQYRHVLENHARSGRWLFVAYEQLLEPSGLDRIEAFTGHRLDRSLPEPSLNRSRPQRAVPGPVGDLYRELCRRAGVRSQGLSGP